MNGTYDTENDLPFDGPSEWYPYHCRACNYKALVEEVFIDSFPPNGPGNCPILGCPECGGDFVRHTTIPTTMSKTDPNQPADNAQNNP